MNSTGTANEEFKQWLALYFIEKGYWKVTDKAVEELGSDAIPKQAMEFAEDYSSKERDERIEYRVGLTSKEKRAIAHQKVADMLEQGKAKEMFVQGYVTHSASWKNEADRKTVVRMLAEKLKKDPRDLTTDDFGNNKLLSLLNHYYRRSPYIAITSSFPELNIQPWEVVSTPKKVYANKKNRVAAMIWLVEKLKKDPCNLTEYDFINNGLRGVLKSYKYSPYKAVKEAFPEMGIKSWEMITTPRGFYEKKKNRSAAVKWLVEKLKKDPRDLTAHDFNTNRLYGLINYYKGSPYEAVKEAGLVNEADENYMRQRGGIGSIISSKEALDAARKMERAHGTANESQTGIAKKQTN